MGAPSRREPLPWPCVRNPERKTRAGTALPRPSSYNAALMRIEKEPAFVLHARPWRETSLLVEVLAENHGRLGLVARGVQGPKKQVLRAALQPLQHIRLEAVQRGELAQLVSAEALDAAPRLAGEAMLAAFYINELVMRLAPRQDPHGGLYRIYAQTRLRLGGGDSWPGPCAASNATCWNRWARVSI